MASICLVTERINSTSNLYREPRISWSWDYVIMDNMYNSPSPSFAIRATVISISISHLIQIKGIMRDNSVASFSVAGKKVEVRLWGLRWFSHLITFDADWTRKINPFNFGNGNEQISHLFWRFKEIPELRSNRICVITHHQMLRRSCKLPSGIAGNCWSVLSKPESRKSNHELWNYSRKATRMDGLGSCFLVLTSMWTLSQLTTLSIMWTRLSLTHSVNYQRSRLNE